MNLMYKTLLKVLLPDHRIPELLEVQQTRDKAEIIMHKVQSDLDNGRTTDSWFIRIRKPPCEKIENDK